MNDNFLNVCEGVNLIVKPCEYRGIRLEPGSLLFDANEELNLKVPFVVVEDVTCERGRIKVDNIKNMILKHSPDEVLLSGCSLYDPQANYIYKDTRSIINFHEDVKNYDKICEAVDLALGEGKLHRLLLESNDNKYCKNKSFYANASDSKFSYVFTHVAGDVYRQYFNTDIRDRLVTLSNDQVNFFNKRSEYGILPTGVDSLGFECDSEFHKFLNAYYGVNYDYFLEEEVDNVRNNLTDYYDSIGGASVDPFIKNGHIRVAFDRVVTRDGFSIEPFTVALDNDFVKWNLYRANRYKSIFTGNFPSYTVSGYEYEPLDDTMLYDGIHDVYLVSYDTYDNTKDYTNGGIDIFRGYVFNGGEYQCVSLAFSDMTPRDVVDRVKNIIRECDYYRRVISEYEFSDKYKFGNLIEDRLNDLKTAGSFTYTDEYDFIEHMYNRCHAKVSARRNPPIEYAKLTDAEFRCTVDTAPLYDSESKLDNTNEIDY